MNKIKNIIINIVSLIVVLILIELTIPAAKGLTYGILHMFWPAIKEFYLSDWILSIILFFVGSLSLFGTIHISRKSENRLWAIVSGIVTIISFVTMFNVAPGE